MAVIETPRPPLNIFDAVHANIDQNWSTLLETPTYLIPAIGPNPQRTVEIVSLLTSLIVTNTGQGTITVSLRIVNANGDFLLLNELPVPANDFALVELSKQNLPSGEILQIRTGEGQNAVAHLSFVSNQREEYEIR